MFPQVTNNMAIPQGGRSYYDDAGNFRLETTLPDWQAQLAAFIRARPKKSPLAAGGGGVNTPSAPEAAPAAAAAHSAPAILPAESKGKPVFIKTVGGPGMIGGQIRLSQWEPGAAFAGYESELGSAPVSSSFGGMIPASAAALGPSSQGVSGTYPAATGGSAATGSSAGDPKYASGSGASNDQANVAWIIEKLKQDPNFLNSLNLRG